MRYVLTKSLKRSLNPKYFAALFLSATFLFCLSGRALASQLISLGKPVTGSAYYSSGSEVFPWDNVTDGRYNDTGSAYDWSFWLTPNGQNGYVVIDLQDSYYLDRFVIQNTHNRGYNDRATLGFAISGSNDKLTWDTLSSGTLTFYNSGYSPIPKETYLSSITKSAYQFVKFDITSHYRSSGGINELEVYGSPVPVPVSFWLLASGLTGLAGLRRYWTARRFSL